LKLKPLPSFGEANMGEATSSHLAVVDAGGAGQWRHN
jgi:hypothetical protein